MTPFVFIGKEIERKAQEGEDLPEGSGPLRYQAGQTGKTRAADAGLILRAGKFSKRCLRDESGVGQHASGIVEPSPRRLRCNGSRWVLRIDGNGVRHNSDLRNGDA